MTVDRHILPTDILFVWSRQLFRIVRLLSVDLLLVRIAWRRIMRRGF